MKTTRWLDNSIWSCARYGFGSPHRRAGWGFFPDCALDLEASRAGELFAQVKDEEVWLQIPTHPPSAWAAAAESAAGEPALREALLAGALPPQIRRHLYQSGIVLEWDALPRGRCSCGAWPCAHACAVVYRLSSVAYQEPQSLLPLYGCDLEAFAEILRDSVSAQPEWGSAFWRAALPLDALPPVALPAASERLGPIGVQVDGADLAERLAPLYARLGEDG